jgi:hypothetical protein
MPRPVLLLALLLSTTACKKTEAPASAANDLKSRPVPTSGLTLWIDGKQTRAVAPTELSDPVALAKITGEPVRAVLVHGDGELWIAGKDVGGYQLKTNRRGQVKLVTASGGEDDDRSAKQLKDVKWIEVRSPASPKLTGEP